MSEQWNRTRNQHFLSQAEQRLNAFNAASPFKKQRIFEFAVVDRESFHIRLTRPKGRTIIGNLSFMDLFTFDTKPARQMQLNFEHLFQRYESNIERLTTRLLDDLVAGRDIDADTLTQLFAAKLVNIARNPYSVPKALNTFGAVADYVPTDPSIRQLFERVLNARNPSQASLCRRLAITDEDYARWLRMLFMLLGVDGVDGLSFLDGMVKALFEDGAQAAAVLVASYTTHCCLLSDRSFSQTTVRDDQVGLEFNLRRDAFIRFLFADIDGIVADAIPRASADRFKRLSRPIVLYYCVDDLNLLRNFNRSAIYQCWSTVYCADKGPLV